MSCNACGALATENARAFVETVVLQQLSRLASSRTGFRGVVIPPPYVTGYDPKEV
jgi:hypothetical protein